MNLTPDTPASMDGLWLSVSELALRKGVKKQTISEKVARLEGQSLITTRAGKGRSKLINVAEYDRAIGETGDAVRELAFASRVSSRDSSYTPGVDDPILAKEQARNAAFTADLKKLDLEERLGLLVPVEDVTASMVQCAESLTRSIDQLSSRADDLASAVAKEGVTGARTFLKAMSRDLRALLAREMKLLASASEQNENTDEDE